MQFVVQLAQEMTCGCPSGRFTPCTTVGTVSDMVGADNVIEFEPTMGAEDFSYYLLEKPGCYFLIGNGDGSHRESGHGMGPCMLHNPSYDFNDELIPLGATLWVRMAEAWLAQPR